MKKNSFKIESPVAQIKALYGPKKQSSVLVALLQIRENQRKLKKGPKRF